MLLAGSIVFLLGVAAERSDQPAFDYLMIGVALFLVGLFLWQKLRPKRERPRRFSLFRKRSEDKDRQGQEGWEDDRYV